MKVSRGGRPGISVLMSLTVSVDVTCNNEPCLGIGHNLSLICQPTSEDMKLYFINPSLTSRETSSHATRQGTLAHSSD